MRRRPPAHGLILLHLLLWGGAALSLTVSLILSAWGGR